MPQTGLLYRIKDYFSGYLTGGKQIFCRRRHAAAKLGICIRTLARYLRHLSELGWMVTVQRKARTAIRQIFPQVTCSTVPSPVPSLASGPFNETTKVKASSEPEQNLSEKIRTVLKRAAKRIARAKNPAAYYGAIVACEKRIEKRDRQFEAVSPAPVKPVPAAPSRPPVPFRGMEDLLGHLSGLGIDVAGAGLKRIPS